MGGCFFLKTPRPRPRRVAVSTSTTPRRWVVNGSTWLLGLLSWNLNLKTSRMVWKAAKLRPLAFDQITELIDKAIVSTQELYPYFIQSFLSLCSFYRTSKNELMNKTGNTNKDKNINLFTKTRLIWESPSFISVYFVIAATRSIISTVLLPACLPPSLPLNWCWNRLCAHRQRC